MNIFDYVGGILSYLIIALAVFGTARFDSLSASDMSVLISEVDTHITIIIRRTAEINKNMAVTPNPVIDINMTCWTKI